jgi:hypothetical protein
LIATETGRYINGGQEACQDSYRSHSKGKRIPGSQQKSRF